MAIETQPSAPALTGNSVSYNSGASWKNPCNDQVLVNKSGSWLAVEEGMIILDEGDEYVVACGTLLGGSDAVLKSGQGEEGGDQFRSEVGISLYSSKSFTTTIKIRGTAKIVDFGGDIEGEDDGMLEINGQPDYALDSCADGVSWCAEWTETITFDGSSWFPLPNIMASISTYYSEEGGESGSGWQTADFTVSVEYLNYIAWSTSIRSNVVAGGGYADQYLTFK